MGGTVQSASSAGTALASAVGRPDTWGLSGPTFLVIYALVGAAAVLVVFLARRTIAGGGTGPKPDRMSADPRELAMINDGETLAVAAAVAELRARGAIDENPENPGRLNVVEMTPRGLDPLEESVLVHLREAPTAKVKEIVAAPSPASTLAAMREHLVAEGLVLTEEQRKRIRRQAGWLVAVIGLGVVRIGAGVANQKPVGFLVMLVGGAFIALVWSLKAPNATTQGRELLKAARLQAAGLEKEVGAGDPRLGLAVALFGTALMWGAEPGLAHALGLPRADGGGEGGGGCGGGCGGCGG